MEAQNEDKLYKYVNKALENITPEELIQCLGICKKYIAMWFLSLNMGWCTVRLLVQIQCKLQQI